jgi:16S rRNA G966 N2-methylase RsmD
LSQIDLFGNKIIKPHSPKLGLTYKGTKQKLSTKILNVINKKIDYKIHDYKIYDLFGGGGSLTLQSAYNNINTHYNEYNTDTYQAFKYIINDGDISSIKNWVTRDDYNNINNKENRTPLESLMKLIYSFGSSGDAYYKSKDKEELTRAIHSLIMYDNQELFTETMTDLIGSQVPEYPTLKGNNYTEKRYYFSQTWSKYYKQLTELQPNNETLKEYETPERVQHLERLQVLINIQTIIKPYTNNISLSNKSYDEININDNSIIYADIPYKDTGGYNKQTFDHEQFYEWALNNKHPIYISEYNMPDDFKKIASFQHKTSIGGTGNSSTVEYLFTN